MNKKNKFFLILAIIVTMVFLVLGLSVLRNHLDEVEIEEQYSIEIAQKISPIQQIGIPVEKPKLKSSIINES